MREDDKTKSLNEMGESCLAVEAQTGLHGIIKIKRSRAGQGSDPGGA